MDLRLLGPVEARVDGRPLALGPPKQRAVLAMLALHVGKTLSADRLVEGLWGEQPPPSAPKMVQLYVSQLRRLLDGNGAQIVTRGRGYELQLADGEVDATRFQRLLEQDRAREALDVWRGEALTDLADEPFAAAEIRRLDELRVRASELAIDADLAAGRHAEVIGELEALLAEHPLRERLHAQRMLALYRAGRQSEALDAYRDARAVLVEQIGVEPGAELQRLQRAILEHDPALELTTAPPQEAKPATRPQRRRPAPILAIAALMLFAGVVAFGISRVTAPDSLPRIDDNAVGVIDADSGRITDRYSVGNSPEAIAAGAGSVWVANRLDGTVARIDREHDEIVTIPVGGEPTGLAFGAGSLWVADGQGRTVAQIDPGVNKIVQWVEVGNAAHAVAVGFGAVWVASAVDDTVVRIDVANGDVSEPIAVGARPTALAAGAGAVWVASDAAASVVRVDPRSRRAVRRISVGNGPSGIAVGAGAVWVPNRMDGTVSRIDPTSERVETVRVGREPRAVAVDERGVWVANAGDGTLVRIDLRSLQVDQPVKVHSSPVALAVVDGKVWSAALAATSTHRGGTLRVSEPAPPGGEPVLLEPSGPNPDVALLYDGLVGYRRAGGSAGGTLVAGLARNLPEPSADGRTYVFRLRPNVRFSNGAPVRPEDVRASIARLLQSSAWSPDDLPPIRGAAGCGPRRCDLSEGVEIDAVAGTVTIHLSRRDPDFLHKLQLAFVVPAGSPAYPTTRLLPGTGPYRIERWDGRRGGLLVRNPYFHVASPDRPDGFPDQIAVQLESPQSQRATMARGAADIALLASYAMVPVDRLKARYGARVHTNPFPATRFVWLNVHAPPFDDVRVRRALNFAVDRARVAELLGAPETYRPTCQLLPPGFEGYKPSCPFTVNPSRAGIWTGPDMPKARRLVAASGTRGIRVEFWEARGVAPLGRYFGSLLHRLGYRSRVRLFADPFLILEEGTTAEARRRARLGQAGWGPSSASPFTFLHSLISCSAGGINLSRFCDPKLDARMEQAAGASGPEAIELWRRVEGTLAAKAPVVPLVNESSISLTAKPVGNYQHHPLWGPLLEQLWVK